MARQQSTTIDNSFIGGLVSDFTALNFPSNACTETENCIFDQSGQVTRREGFEFEDGYALKTLVQGEGVVSSFIWREVNGDGSLNLFVVQTGETLYFYNILSGAVSASPITSSISLLSFDAPTASNVGFQSCQFTNGRGVLFVSHPQCDPFYVTYNEAANTVSGTAITVQIRDLVGVSDGLAVDERPTSTVAGLTATHKYNLFNQGWYFNSNAALTAWDAALTTMPSNADVWWRFKNTSDAFDAATVPNVDSGNTPASKGHYILSAFNEDRSTVSGIATLTVVTTNPQRPRAIAFFAGRVWYAGVDYSGYNNILYFSQIVESSTQYGYCYQKNDPTSELLFELLPTDGGTLQLQGAGVIYKLFVLDNSLLVFASNGVWAISGSQGLGFVANDFSISKISAIENTNSSTFIDVEGIPYWWTGESIYTMQGNQNALSGSVSYSVQSLSDNKIRNFFLDDLPSISKQQAVGAYDPSSRTIQWLYRSTEPGTIRDINAYDRILIYNLLTQAFYLWTFNGAHAIKIHAVNTFKGFAGDSAAISVITAASDNVIDSSSNQVVVYDIQGNTTVPIFKYLISYLDGADDKFTFAEERSSTYLDWKTYDSIGTDYSSFFITGYRVHAETQRYFQTNYVFVFLEQENTASCFVQGIYDYTTSADSGKWSTPQQVYNSSLTNRAVNFKRLKVRGKGRAMQLKFYSSTGLPFTIVGWSIWETANAQL